MPTLSLSADLIFPLALSGPVAPFLLVKTEVPHALCWPVMDKSEAATPFFLSKIMTLASNQGTVLVIFLLKKAVLAVRPVFNLSDCGWIFLAGLWKAQG